jgi:hypothetical protein
VQVTDMPCEHCKESDRRDTLNLVQLSNTTRRQRLKVRVCPHCDGEEVIRLSEKPNDKDEPLIS